MSDWIINVSRPPLRIFCTAFWRLRVFDAHHVPREGGVILASTHQSFLDPPLIGACIDRPLCFMARSTLFRNPIFGAIIRAYEAFSVERDTADLRGVREAIDRLRAGRGVLLFPEGTRTWTGRIGRVKGGVSMIAEHAGVPVVPVLVEGAFRAWPRRNVLPAPRPINIIFGSPVNARAGFPGPDDLREMWKGLSRRPRRTIRGGVIDVEP